MAHEHLDLIEPGEPSLGRRMIAAGSVLLALIAALTVVAGTGQPAPSATGAAPPNRPAGVLFVRASGLAGELWLADRDGANPRLLLPSVSGFSASPDGNTIAYATQPESEPSRINIYDRASGQSRLLAGAADWVALAPSWSPAGGPGVIAYERRSITESGVGTPKLWLARDDGSDLGAVLRGGDIVTFGAAWSPDGTRLAFIDPLRNEIVLFNFSDILRRVPLQGEFDWSPDSARLIVSTFAAGQESRTRLVIYDLNAEAARPVFAAADSDDYMPRWSPDGRRVAFVRRARTAPQGAIWVGDLDDGAAVRVSPPAADGGRVDDSDPQWSPDGSELIWTRRELGAQAGPPAVWRAQIANLAAATLLIDNASEARWIK